jgi:hypothetical protein
MQKQVCLILNFQPVLQTEFPRDQIVNLLTEIVLPPIFTDDDAVISGHEIPIVDILFQPFARLFIPFFRHSPKLVNKIKKISEHKPIGYLGMLIFDLV